MTDIYARPTAIDDATHRFPSRLGELLPPRGDIPAYYAHKAEWTDFQYTWFHQGLPDDVKVFGIGDIDPEEAMRHLGAIQDSFEPKHEHKREAVAWLASRWLHHVEDGSGKQIYP